MIHPDQHEGFYWLWSKNPVYYLKECIGDSKMIDSRMRKYFQALFDFLAKKLIGMGVTPNQVTTLAFLTGIAAGIVVLYELYWLSLTLLWISGLFDVLDGTVARLGGKSSAGGAFLDLIFDRVVEAVFIILFALARPEIYPAALVFLGAVIFNFSTFMLAGKLFENSGEKSMHYDSGLIERTETFIAFSAMLLLPSQASLVLWTFNALVLITGVYRFIKILRYTQKHSLF